MWLSNSHLLSNTNESLFVFAKIQTFHGLITFNLVKRCVEFKQQRLNFGHMEITLIGLSVQKSQPSQHIFHIMTAGLSLHRN